MGIKPPAWHMEKGEGVECGRNRCKLLITPEWNKVTCIYCLRRSPDPKIRDKAKESVGGHKTYEKDQCTDKAQIRNIFDRYVQIGETILFND